MTTSQKASAMKVHPQTIRRWTKTGKLDCTRTIGNHRRFEPQDDPKQRRPDITKAKKTLNWENAVGD